MCRVYNNHIFIDYRDERLGANATIDWDTAPGYSVGNTNLSRAQWEVFHQGEDVIGAAIHTGPHCTEKDCHTQSLPDFDNPCSRLWTKYFADNATALTWFNNRQAFNHSVDHGQFLVDCNDKVKRWREGVKQIRLVLVGTQM